MHLWMLTQPYPLPTSSNQRSSNLVFIGNVVGESEMLSAEAWVMDL